MAASTKTGEAGAWPQTRCEKCQTVFEVPAELLESNDTRVRCGECLSIFDALEGVERQTAINHDALQQNDETAALAGANQTQGNQPLEGIDEFSNLDVTYSDFDLFSEEADVPEVRYFEEASDRVDFNFDSVEIDHDQTFSETLFVNDVTIDADLPLKAQQSKAEVGPTDHYTSAVAPQGLDSLGVQAKVDFSRPAPASASEPLVFQYHDPDDTGDVDATDVDGADSLTGFSDGQHETLVRRRVRFNWLQCTLSVLALCLLLSALYLYRERARLYNDMRVRPVYTAFCALARCSVPLPFDPDQMGLLRRSIYPHPQVPDALVINVVIKNKADFDQRYPVLVIRLEENSGAPLATRDFPPQDYLEPRQWHENAMIEAGNTISITLEIKDPGENAASFTLNFR